jgi:hypothetical protein
MKTETQRKDLLFRSVGFFWAFIAVMTAKIIMELVIFSRMRNSISVTGAITDTEEISLSPNPSDKVNRIIAIKINGSYSIKSQEIMSATNLT